ncbi:MAG: hypothetical protein KY437_04290 [Actinobacteria bacterium]|nr:hypothetical protein [Actinomycetota bacterium]
MGEAVMRPSRLRRAIPAAVVTALLAFAAVGPTAAAQEATEEPPDAVYTMLGRGYAVIFGYPADEIPGSDDGGDEEEGGEEEEPAEPMPDQTCPEDQRGVPEELQARIEQLSDTSDHDPVEAEENEVPTPRGQPIKFDFGLADTSLRSDPGSHAIASFMYVDLGGGIDPQTTAEADGYASGHARYQERCSQPFSSSEGDAEDVHVIAEAIEGPYAYAFNQTQRPTSPGVTFKESITVAEMDGRSDPVWGKVTVITQGVAAGEIHADEVVTVIEVTTDGTDGGTTIKAFTDVVGLSVAGTPMEVTSGAPPVSAGAHLVGVAAPEVRTRPDGTIEVTAGGMYVAGRVDNPLGLQRSQAAFIGGAWYDFSIASFPSFDDDFEDEFEQAPPPPPADPAPPTDTGFSAPSQPVAEPPAFEPAPQAEVAQQPTRDEEPQVAPEMVAASNRYGVYRAGPQTIGTSLALAAFLMSLMTGVFVWARHTYPEIRAALGVPMFRWLDHAYRAFMRG